MAQIKPVSAIGYFGWILHNSSQIFYELPSALADGSDFSRILALAKLKMSIINQILALAKAKRLMDIYFFFD